MKNNFDIRIQQEISFGITSKKKLSSEKQPKNQYCIRAFTRLLNGRQSFHDISIFLHPKTPTRYAVLGTGYALNPSFKLASVCRSNVELWLQSSGYLSGHVVPKQDTTNMEVSGTTVDSSKPLTIFGKSSGSKIHL